MRVDGRVLDWPWGPLEVLGRWPRDRRVVMLHSGRFDARWARYSILAQPEGTYRFGIESGGLSAADPAGFRSQWVGGRRPCPVDRFTGHPFGDLRSLLAATAATGGLWIGYLGYDVGRWVETRLRGIAVRGDWPVIELGYCPGYLVHDGLTGAWRACGAWRDAELDFLQDLPREPVAFTAVDLKSNFSREGYKEAVGRVKEAIGAGDVYQVNLAQRLTSELAFDYSGSAGGDETAWSIPEVARVLYGRLAGVSPAWFGAYLELSCGVRAVASASPELFLRVDGRGVVTRPIKGTRPASVPAAALRDSEKDQAELNMIVDLMRNDLGRVCAYGSVRVAEARAIETHPTVHHAAATVTGELHESKDMVDLLRATLPGGSVTGTPKIRAMELIQEIEPAGRGPYCGCIGYLTQESACLNVAIRTALIDATKRRLDFSVGGGIVADSDPESEYQETLDKAAAILEALKPAQPAARGS